MNRAFIVLAGLAALAATCLFWVWVGALIWRAFNG